MVTDSKENEKEESQWLIHIYDAGYVWIAYQRSAYLLLYVLGTDVHAHTIIDRPSGYPVFKAEITKKDFARLVPLSSIIHDDTYHKILDFHISHHEFEAWMDNEGIPYIT